MRYYYIRRLVTNGVLGAALTIPVSLYFFGAVHPITAKIDWDNVHWIHLGIVGLYGAIAFQYLSISLARMRVVNIFIAGVAGIGCFLGIAFMIDVLLWLLQYPPVTPTTTAMLMFTGACEMFGVLMWLRANAVSLPQLLRTPD